MTDRAPALGTPVLIRGRYVGIDLATDAARIETESGTISVPRGTISDGALADAEAKWRAHRDANVRRGLTVNGISKRDFLAGYAAAA